MIRFLTGLLLFSASAFLASGVWLCFVTVKSERSITAATLENEKAITASLISVPTLADTHLKTIEGKVDAVTQLAAGAIATIDKRLGSIQSDANLQLGQANESISQVSGVVAIALPQITASVPALTASASTALASISTDVHSVAAPIAVTAAHVADAAPQFTDCEYLDPVTGEVLGGNPDCLQNRWVGVSRATEQTMQAVAKAAPRIADTTEKLETSAASIAASTDKEVQELMKPRKWWQRVIDYINLAAIAAAHAI